MTSRADYTDWESYVTAECERFYAHTEGVTYIFGDSPAAAKYLDRCAKRGTSSEQAAFTGPWHVVRKLVTTEFRQWVEEYEASERITLSQWQVMAKQARAEISWEESADRALDKLDMLRRLTAERDELILEAARKGSTKVAIAQAVGLSRQQVHAVIAAAEASVPDVAPFDEWADVTAAGAF